LATTIARFTSNSRADVPGKGNASKVVPDRNLKRIVDAAPDMMDDGFRVGRCDKRLQWKMKKEEKKEEKRASQPKNNRKNRETDKQRLLGDSPLRIWVATTQKWSLFVFLNKSTL